MTNIQDEALSVTQADRDAAADLTRCETSLTRRRRENGYRSGALDYSPLVQALARHRLSHSTPGDAEVMSEAQGRIVMASARLGRWMSAALDDPAVCEEMKADIREWFSAGEPIATPSGRAQGEVEPFVDPAAWLYTDPEGRSWAFPERRPYFAGWTETPLYAAPPAQDQTDAR